MRTIQGLRKALHDRGLDATVSGLEVAIEQEASDLRKGFRMQSTIKSRQASRASAEDYYAKDIAELFDSSDPESGIPFPSPESILGLRRVTVAWAVAEVVRSNRVKWED